MNEASISLIKLQNKKEYNKAMTNSYVEGIVKQIKIMLKNDKLRLNYTPYELHFNNGYIDVRDMKFKQRTSDHKVTDVIDREYKKSTKEERRQYMDIIKKIYPNDEDREKILLMLSTCLSWKATSNNFALFLVGVGSTAKSTIIQSLGKAIGPYFKELKSDAFSNDKTLDKTLNTYFKRPQILLTQVNEMKGRINDSVYKNFTQGKINTNK